MEKTAIYAVSTGPLLKREDCKRTKHDSDFSEWKILIGPCDWEDYLSNKEGAERYRTHNLPNCSSCSGLYELGIPVSLPRLVGKGSSKLDSKHIIPVYLGEADNVRTRLQQYGRDGAHLENGWLNGDPNYRKVRGLFVDIFSKGFAVAFRWAPMESKNDAKKTETQLLKTFDYAWNKGMNGERRPSDIHRKLNISTSSKSLPPVFKDFHIFPPKKVGLNIKTCDSSKFEIGSSFYIMPEDTNILSRIIKFNQSRPTLVSKERDNNNNNNNSEADYCGVALGRGSMCTKPPVEGRKRCVDHKGMKVNEFLKPGLLSNTDDTRHLICGVALNDGSICTQVPVAGRKRCEEHKQMRIIPLEKGLDARPSCNRQKNCDIGDGLLTCGATTLNGSFCRRKRGENSKFCWQHNTNHSSRVLDLYGSSNSSTCGALTKHGTFFSSSSNSSTCGALTKRGTFCSRRTTGGQRCFQH